MTLTIKYNDCFGYYISKTTTTWPDYMWKNGQFRGHMEDKQYSKRPRECMQTIKKFFKVKKSSSLDGITSVIIENG